MERRDDHDRVGLVGDHAEGSEAARRKGRESVQRLLDDQLRGARVRTLGNLELTLQFPEGESVGEGRSGHIDDLHDAVRSLALVAVSLAFAAATAVAMTRRAGDRCGCERRYQGDARHTEEAETRTSGVVSTKHGHTISSENPDSAQLSNC